MRTYTVRAFWDEEANVWVAESDDVPGLATEASGLDELRKKLVIMIPELLTENGEQLSETSQIEYQLHVSFRSALGHVA